MSDMVKVGCKIVNGIFLRLFKQGYDDGTGDSVKPTIVDGPGVRLNGPPALHTGAGNTAGAGLAPVVTEVDGAWMAAWLEQNKLNPFVGEGLIYVIDEKSPK